MKIRTKRMPLKAASIFTDREEPRATFWQQYRCVEEEMRNKESNVHVLTYYGIGGIGKSTLLKKMMEEMEERLSKPTYVYFDFNLQQESRAVLETLKNKLADSYAFNFPLFELGSYLYAKKIGENPDAPEAKPLLKKSPAVELLLNIAGEIPVVGSATKILDLAEKCVAVFHGYLQEHRKELNQIEQMEPEELYAYLPLLFAEDLACAMEKQAVPLVVFLDTYECLVNEMSATGEPLSKDVWLRGENGLVQNIPGVLWVIAGRERLKWERFDTEWQDALQQHLLGGLSEQDGDQFLLAAGVTDGELRRCLYELTAGTPVYLDLCVDQHRRMKERGIEPKAELFGCDTFDLIERFGRYMDDAQKEIVDLLACMGHWNDHDIETIARQVVPGFRMTTYEKVKSLSFITQSDTGDYNIHKTVGEVLLESCPALLRERAARCGLEYFAAVLKETTLLDLRYAEALRYCVRFSLLLSRGDDDALWKLCRQYVVGPLSRLNVAERGARTDGVVEPLIRRADAAPDTRFYGNIYSIYSDNLRFKGDQTGALAAAEKAWNCLRSCLGEEHEETLSAGFKYVIALYITGREKESKKLKEMIFKKCREVLGDDHWLTLTVMRTYAMDLGRAGRIKEALEINGRVLEKMERIYGLCDRDTLHTMATNVLYLNSAGRTQEALELADRVLALSREALGEGHPDVQSRMSDKAAVLEKMGCWEEALPLYREVYEKYQQRYGWKNAKTVSAVTKLIAALKKMGEYEQILPLSRQACEASRYLYGQKDARTAAALENLAEACFMAGKYEDALEMNRCLTEIYREEPKEQDKLLRATKNTAITLRKMGRWEEALPLYREVYENHLQHYGQKDARTAAALDSLAGACFMAGKYEDALEMYRCLTEIYREEPKKQDELLRTMKNTAITLRKLDRTGETLEIYCQLLKDCTALYGADHPETLSVARQIRQLSGE